MNTDRIKIALMVAGIPIILTGCDVIGGIFKTGIGVGVVAAIIIVVLIVVIARAGRRRY